MSEPVPGAKVEGRSYRVFAVAFVVFALATPAAIFASLDGLEVENVEVGLDVVDVLEDGLPELASASARGSFAIGFLGDSMVVSYPPGRTVPARLEQAARAARGPRGEIEVRSLASPGMGPFDYYFIADLVAAARPDQVILPFNLAALSDPWRGTFSRPELGGWLAPRRVPGAMLLPLEWVGLTTDRLLLYVGIVQSGAADPWHGVVRQQARLGRLRTIVAGRLDKLFRSTATMNFGTARFRFSDKRSIIPGYPATADKPGRKKRLTAWGLRQRFGPALDGISPDNPTVRVLAATVARFRRDGIRVLVYTNPTNATNMAEARVLDEKGLAQTMDVIATAVRSAGGEFADLHRLLPDRAFRDAAGHFNVKDGAPDGPRLLGDALAPLVLEEARAAARAERGG